MSSPALVLDKEESQIVLTAGRHGTMSGERPSCIYYEAGNTQSPKHFLAMWDIEKQIKENHSMKNSLALSSKFIPIL